MKFFSHFSYHNFYLVFSVLLRTFKDLCWDLTAVFFFFLFLLFVFASPFWFCVLCQLLITIAFCNGRVPKEEANERHLTL